MEILNGGEFEKPYFLKESMILKWNLRRGGWVEN